MRVVDWELRSRWPSGGEVTNLTSSFGIKEQIENRLLDAIEKKHHNDNRNFKIYKLYLDGFKQRELSKKFLLSQQHISRIIRKVYVKGVKRLT